MGYEYQTQKHDYVVRHSENCKFLFKKERFGWNKTYSTTVTFPETLELNKCLEIFSQINEKLKWDNYLVSLPEWLISSRIDCQRDIRY